MDIVDFGNFHMSFKYHSMNRRKEKVAYCHKNPISTHIGLFVLDVCHETFREINAESPQDNHHDGCVSCKLLIHPL